MRYRSVVGKHESSYTSYMIDRNLKIINLLKFCNGFNLYLAIAVIYFQQISGSYTLAMTVLAITLVATAVFEIPTSVLSDKTGRKITLVLGAIASIGSVLCFILAQGFWLMAGGAVLAGLSAAFCSGTIEALLYDTLKDEKREQDYAESYGRTSAFFQIGLALSGLAAAAITFAFSLHAVFIFSLVAPIVWLVASFFLVEPRSHKKSELGGWTHIREALRAFKSNKKLRTLSFASILDEAIEETAYRFGPVFIAMVWPLWAVGIARFLSGAFGTIGFWLAGRWIRKFGHFASIVYGKAYGRLASLIAFIFPTPISPILMTSTDYFYMIELTAQNDIMQQGFTDRQRATMASIISVVGSASFGIFAFCFGKLADSLPANQALILAQGLLLLVIGVYVMALRQRKHLPQAPESPLRTYDDSKITH